MRHAATSEISSEHLEEEREREDIERADQVGGGPVRSDGPDDALKCATCTSKAKEAIGVAARPLTTPLAWLHDEGVLGRRRLDIANQHALPRQTQTGGINIWPASCGRRRRHEIAD